MTSAFFYRSVFLGSSILIWLASGQTHAPILQQLTFVPYHSNGIYNIGETVGWHVEPGPSTPTYLYKWTIRRNNAVVLKEGQLDLSSGQDKIEVTGDQPEMIYVAVQAFSQIGDSNGTSMSADSKPGTASGGERL